MTFAVGQKIRCIADSPIPQFGESMPVPGAIYTVRAMVSLPGGLGVQLAEITNQPHDYMGDGKPFECAFNPRRFEPTTEVLY